MALDETVLVSVAAYARLHDARNDYEVLTRRCVGGIVHTSETTVVGRELDGKLTVATACLPDRGKAWIALAAGELRGLFVPPFLLWDDAWRGDPDALVGEFWKGLSREDLRVIAAMLQTCAAAVIVISESELQAVLRQTLRGTFIVFQKLVVSAA
jgi:hypothetical protein